MAPGIQKPGIPRSTSLKQTASQNVGGTTRSKYYSNNAKYSYGIFAQRGLNPLKMRADYGSSVSVSYKNTTYANGSAGYSPACNSYSCGGGSNAWQNATLFAMGGLGAIMGGIKLYNAIAPDKKADAAATSSTTATANTVPSTAAGTGSLNAMKGAKDSVSLRSAIETATSEKTTMEAKVNELAGKIPGLKEAADTAQKTVAKLDADIKKQEGVVQEKEKTFQKAEQEVKNCASAKDNAQKNLTSAEDRLASANQSLEAANTKCRDAEKSLSDAQSALSSTPRTNADGTPNANYAAAEAKVAAAKTAVANARTEQRNATGLKDKAEADKTNAEKNYETTLKQFEDSKTALESAEKAKTEAKEELNAEKDKLAQLKTEQGGQQKIIDEYNNAVKEQQAKQSELQALTPEIEKQNARLKELEAKEAKDLDDTGSKLDKLQTDVVNRTKGIDASDGLNKTELNAMQANDIDNKASASLLEQQKATQHKVDVARTYNSPATETANSIAFRKGTAKNGEDIYMIGAKVVDKAQYEARLASEKARPGATA